MKSLLRDNFCSSPWFHIRIDWAGNYLPCRWSNNVDVSSYNIENTSMVEYMNSSFMQDLRTRLLNGVPEKMCASCRYEDQHSKVSGRQKQLLKSAVNLDNFQKTLCASPHFDDFNYSFNNNGLTTRTPVDLQIDLGNTCNSACVICAPTFSSRLAHEYIKLQVINPELFTVNSPGANWTDAPALVDKFVSELEDYPDIKYIHFLGGETLYLKSFYDICNRLIKSGYSKNVSIGTTTNCTVATPELEHIIREFKHVHLGLSVECFHPVNDYVRYPSRIDSVTENINRFIELRKQTGMHLALRITPNILTITHLDTIFRFMLDHNIAAESCNILHSPSCLRLELLPKDLVELVQTKIDQVITDYNLVNDETAIVNRRSEDLTGTVISNVIFEYQSLMATLPTVNNIEKERYKLVDYLKAFEQVHDNKILDYLPEYEEFLRSYGY